MTESTAAAPADPACSDGPARSDRTAQPHGTRSDAGRDDTGPQQTGPQQTGPHGAGRHAGSRRAVPTREQLVAWRAFLHAHARVTRSLEAELVAEQKLSLAAYDVLVQLAEAPERRLRMTELADAVLLSRSGVTRLVDRLERAGLVARSRVRSDGRGIAAQLTDAGLTRLHVASRTHLAGIVRHFAARLDDEDLRALGRISRRLVE